MDYDPANPALREGFNQQHPLCPFITQPFVVSQITNNYWMQISNSSHSQPSHPLSIHHHNHPPSNIPPNITNAEAGYQLAAMSSANAPNQQQHTGSFRHGDSSG